MAEISGVEMLTPAVSEGKASSKFHQAIGEFRGIKKELGSREGVITLDEILDRVYRWETENDKKVTPAEAESLYILSLILKTVEVSTEKREKGDRLEIQKANLQNIETQRDIVRHVFQNVDSKGIPNEAVVESFGLVCSVFEDILNPGTPEKFERGVIREVGLWQGAVGMITAAQMFNRIGWRVGFADPLLDLRYDVDFVAFDPEGEAFSVDVSSGIMPEGIGRQDLEEGLFYVRKGRVRQEELLSKIPNLRGTIRVNFPPLWHAEAEEFYDHARKHSACPAQWAVERFRDLLK
jgi:hypothetical protein